MPCNAQTMGVVCLKQTANIWPPLWAAKSALCSWPDLNLIRVGHVMADIDKLALLQIQFQDCLAPGSCLAGLWTTMLSLAIGSSRVYICAVIMFDWAKKIRIKGLNLDITWIFAIDFQESRV
ncbi:hypothetical protein C8R44DRAFT_740091 [Mycena epipterygia]|nr:hypothetical protein C8R44DRAFT_740091 [Mycena epipterygia]